MQADNRIFASRYPREGNLILFPRDVKERKELFPDDVFEHPAKMSLCLTQELIEYLTKPGDSIIDPFGGTGTTAIGLLMGRNVVLIELETHFLEILTELHKLWEGKHKQKFYVMAGDCRQVLANLPFLCDAAIFSPPYANTLKGKGFHDADRYTVDAVNRYVGGPLNMSNLNQFQFVQGMSLVYKRLHAKLVPGARMAVVTKDTMRGPSRQLLAPQVIAQAQKCGFKFEEWHKWKPPGSMGQAVARSKGGLVVEDEDILIFRREP